MKGQEYSDTNTENNYQKSKEKDGICNTSVLKNRRITRRMKKIMSKSHPFQKRQNDQKCAICLSQCSKNSATLQCSHAFCMDCISNWWLTNSTCPYCRASFQFIYDYKGRRLLKSQVPENLLIKREETLKCQSCWADIGDETMRICFDCRCVYIHKRCLIGDQAKIKKWKCQQCDKNEEIQFQKNEIERQGDEYFISIDLDEIIQRHSQRIIYQHQGQKRK